MREYRIKKGKFEGLHKIYDNPEEAKKDGIDNIVDEWWKANPGQWVKADDGFVFQLLDKSKVINKSHKQGQYTLVFRFPMVTLPVYVAVGGYINPKYTSNLYGGISYLRRANSMSKSKNKPEENIWLMRVKKGMNPYTAYAMTFPFSNRKYYDNFSKKPNSLNNKQHKVNQLIDKYRDEIMDGLKGFLGDIRNKIEEQTGRDPDELIAEQLANLMATNTPGTKKDKDVRENIKLYMQLMYSHAGKKNPKEIQESQWEEEKPPLLDKNNKEDKGNG